MAILVTGAAGFIGRSLSESLLNQGHEVFGIDNLNDYYSPALKESRLATLLPRENFHFENFDLADGKKVNSFFADSKFNFVYHLAAQAGVRLKPSELDRYISSNISGFTNVLNSVIKREVPNFIYASSSSVYGDVDHEILSETSTPSLPTSYYGSTKLFNEHAARVLSKGSKTKTRGLRFFTVYGPMGRPDMAYFRIITSLLTATEFKLFGDGKIKRDFTYIDDVTKSVILLGEQLATLVESYSDVVNVGGGRPQSMRELIETSEKLVGKELNLSEWSANLNDVKHTEADTTLIEELTNFKPTIPIEVGLKNFLEWARTDEVMENLNNWVASSK